MPKEIELTKLQIWNLDLIQNYFGSLMKGQLWTFIESEEVQRFLRDAERGVFGGHVPDGTPGSKFPGTGAQDPLDVLDGLFRGPAFALGRIDHAGGKDPAAAPDGYSVLPDGTRQYIHTNPENGDRVTVWTYTNGAVRTWISHTDGSAEGFFLRPDGSAILVRVENTGHSRDMGAGISDGNSTQVAVMRGANSREFLTVTSHHVNGSIDYNPERRVWRRENSPGEDGREANTARNPLDNLDLIGPQSLWQMTEALRNPGQDAGKLDPNTGKEGLKLTDAQQEQLGRIAPALDTLDPNSGIDPLTNLNLDPNQLQTRTEDDDRIDPNTGLKPMPGGG